MQTMNLELRALICSHWHYNYVHGIIQIECPLIDAEYVKYFIICIWTIQVSAFIILYTRAICSDNVQLRSSDRLLSLRPYLPCEHSKGQVTFSITRIFILVTFMLFLFIGHLGVKTGPPGLKKQNPCEH